jgi:hypothetical protein
LFDSLNTGILRSLRMTAPEVFQYLLDEQSEALNQLLIWIRFSGANDADVMVGEFIVSAWEFVLGHVAGDAIFQAYRAGGSHPVRGRLGNLASPEMAGKAFGVVKSRIRSDSLMGIVACQAAYACVCGSKQRLLARR